MSVKTSNYMTGDGTGGTVVAVAISTPWIKATDLTTQQNGTPDAIYASDVAAAPAGLASNNVIDIPNNATYLELNPQLNLSVFGTAPIIRVWTRDKNGVYDQILNVNGTTPVITATPVEANASPLTYVVPPSAANDYRFDLRGAGAPNGSAKLIIQVLTAAAGSSIASPLYVKFD